MKKILSGLIAAVLSIGSVIYTAAGISAETVAVEPDYPIHGNKCGPYLLQLSWIEMFI